MNERQSISQFAFDLGKVMGSLSSPAIMKYLGSPAIMKYLADRGVSEIETNEAYQALLRVAEAFYREPK